MNYIKNTWLKRILSFITMAALSLGLVFTAGYQETFPIFDFLETDSSTSTAMPEVVPQTPLEESIQNAENSLLSIIQETTSIEKNKAYISKDEVSLYLRLYAQLPPNFITKENARNLGWDSKIGNLQEVAPEKSIGGDFSGNFEGLLPKKEGRLYTECDIDYTGGYRGEKRLVFSNDGLIYYTDDHYKSFTLLHGETTI